MVQLAMVTALGASKDSQIAPPPLLRPNSVFGELLVRELPVNVQSLMVLFAPDPSSSHKAPPSRSAELLLNVHRLIVAPLVQAMAPPAPKFRTVLPVA